MVDLAHAKLWYAFPSSSVEPSQAMLMQSPIAWIWLFQNSRQNSMPIHINYAYVI